MKINLGKIILILIMPYLMYAKVTLNAPKSFFQGETVSFSIVASGGDIKIPKITKIDGIFVHSTGTSTQTTIINGKRSYRFTKSYAFIAKKDITIPSFDITIDNKIEKTIATKITMKKVNKTSSKDYDLNIKIDKTSSYVGEGITFELLFKYKKDLNVVNLEFEKPDFVDFWVKELKTNQKQPSDDQYSYQKLTYLLFPQKSGKFTIGPLKIGLIVRDNKYQNSFFASSSTKNIPVYSNTLNLDIKALPNDIKLIGDFEISSSIDKNRLDQGDAVSYKIMIKGRGNIDDVDEIKIDIENTTIYDNPAKKEYNMENNTYGGTYTKAFSIVSTSDFTIPGVTVKYFDKKTNSVKTIKTKSYDIKVSEQEKIKPKLEVSKTDTEITKSITKEKIVRKIIKTSDNQKIIYFIIGLLVGIILFAIFNYLKNKTIKKEDDPIIKSIKNIKTSTQLYKLLIAYIDIDKNLDNIIFRLENDLDGIELKKIKKEIIDIFKELEKKDTKLDTSF